MWTVSIQRDWFDYAGLFISLIAPILGVLGAYLIFRTQIRHERNIEVRRKNEHLREIKDYLVDSLKMSFQPALSQAKKFHELADLLKENKVVDLFLTGISSFNQQWFVSIDKIELREVFILYCKGEDKSWKNYLWNQLNIEIGLLDKIKLTFEDEFWTLQSNRSKFQDLFYDGLRKVMDYSDKIKTKVQTSQPLTKDEEIFADATKDWRREQDRDIRADMFFQYQSLIKTLEQPLIDNYLQELIDSCRTCDFAFKSYIQQRDLYGQQFANFSKSITSAVLRLKVITKYLE